MKPRIKKNLGIWVCEGLGCCMTGITPQYAYAKWWIGINNAHPIVNLPQAGNDLGPALGAPEKQSPSKDGLAVTLSVLTAIGVWMIAIGLALHHLS